MARQASKELTRFLKSFPPDVRRTALFLRKSVLQDYPDCCELIYDNYNALAIGFAVSDRAGDAFCSIAVYARYSNFGFNRGSEIDDPERILAGSGKLYRSLTVRSPKEFPVRYIKKLLRVARKNSVKRLKEKKQVVRGLTIVKAVARVKRRPK